LGKADVLLNQQRTNMYLDCRNILKRDPDLAGLMTASPKVNQIKPTDMGT